MQPSIGMEQLEIRAAADMLGIDEYVRECPGGGNRPANSLPGPGAVVLDKGQSISCDWL